MFWQVIDKSHQSLPTRKDPTSTIACIYYDLMYIGFVVVRVCEGAALGYASYYTANTVTQYTETSHLTLVQLVT